MIHTQLMRSQGILIVSPAGKLETADFDRLQHLVDPYIEEHGELNGMLIDAKAFPGWQDFASMLSHLRFVRDHHKHIRRIAAVTDSGILAILPRIADHFAAAQVRHFHYRDRGAALAWLQARQTLS